MPRKTGCRVSRPDASTEMRNPSPIRTEQSELDSTLKLRAAHQHSQATSRRDPFVERSAAPCPDGSNEISSSHSAHILRPLYSLAHPRKNPTGRLLVMKFGGTSVRDASCIEKVAAIVHTTARENRVAVVVSAMSGVTNALVDAATQAQIGNAASVSSILEELCRRHESAADALIKSPKRRKHTHRRIGDVMRKCISLCDEI